ncbi:hypothetical protein SAMN04515656_104129 [Eubacterium aggregans]|uniref:Uncharacterized protein n=1 Tax=Eubacterium aggregans TaxID=81409 RepID=A0A1H3YWG8_9FIRM|nr:hypothetical protein [Eubacterium aggregans]SEA15438.1 hypothetical protein SAMN04515656_104129 [Eubacterium aggregans]
MTPNGKYKMVAILVAIALFVVGVWAVKAYSGGWPTVETRTTVYVVPWPWTLEWQDGGQSTIEAGSDLAAVTSWFEKARWEDCWNIKAFYRLDDNGCIAAELDLVAAEFAMEVK